MTNDRKFSDIHDNIDFSGIEDWCEEYFQTTLGMLNVFFGKLPPGEVVERLKSIPVAEMAAEHLENELERVRIYASDQLQKRLAMEIEYYEAYARLAQE